MQLTERDIREFQELYRKEFGVELSVQQAAVELRALVAIVRMLVGLE